jgi:hypothetical protein
MIVLNWREKTSFPGYFTTIQSQIMFRMQYEALRMVLCEPKNLQSYQLFELLSKRNLFPLWRNKKEFVSLTEWSPYEFEAINTI